MKRYYNENNRLTTELYDIFLLNDIHKNETLYNRLHNNINDSIRLIHL